MIVDFPPSSETKIIIKNDKEIISKVTYIMNDLGWKKIGSDKNTLYYNISPSLLSILGEVLSITIITHKPNNTISLKIISKSYMPQICDFGKNIINIKILKKKIISLFEVVEVK